MWPFSLLQGTLEEHLRLGNNATLMSDAQKKKVTNANWSPGYHFMSAYCQVLGKYKEFNILFPTTGQHQRYGYNKSVLLAKAQEKKVIRVVSECLMHKKK